MLSNNSCANMIEKLRMIIPFEQKVRKKTICCLIIHYSKLKIIYSSNIKKKQLNKLENIVLGKIFIKIEPVKNIFNT